METIGEPRRRAAFAKGGSARRGSGTSAGSAALVPRLPALRVADGAHPVAVQLDRFHESAAVHHSPAPAEVCGQALVQAAVSGAEEDQARGVAAAQEGLAEDLAEEHGGGALGGLVEDRGGERIPEQPPRRCRLARAPEPFRERDVARHAPQAGAQAQAHGVQARAPGQPQGNEPGQQVPGRGQGRAVQRRPAAVVAVVDAEVVLDEQQVASARAPHEVQRGLVAGDHQVRPVVHVLAGDGVGERGGAAAQHAASLEQQHVVPALL